MADQQRIKTGGQRGKSHSGSHKNLKDETSILTPLAAG